MKKNQNHLRILGILTLIVFLLMTGYVAAAQASNTFTFTMVENGVVTSHQVYEGADNVNIKKSDDGDLIVTAETPCGVQKTIIPSKSKSK